MHLHHLASNDLAANLERAWLLNSQALSAAFQFRKTGDQDRWSAAFRLVQEAFLLATKIRSPAGQYLCYNLAANTVFLLEMRGEFAAALRLLEKAFAHLREDSQQPIDNHGFVYRKAVLELRQSRNAEALAALHHLVAQCSPAEWFMKERVLRTLAGIHSKHGEIEAAEEASQLGLDLCLNERSGTAAKCHAQNLYAIYAKSNRSKLAAAILESRGLKSRLGRVDL